MAFRNSAMMMKIVTSLTVLFSLTEASGRPNEFKVREMKVTNSSEYSS